MPKIGTFLLAKVFSALLPPVDSKERDFYDILGVPSDATNEQIRKAYKKQSLKLHPDKVAQRRDTNVEEAAKEYEKVQEAYGVLVNPEKRQEYNILGKSPTRFRFVAQGTLTNPGSLYENLTGASVVDKTRLVLLCSVLVMIVLMQPILICAKINHLLEARGALEDAKWTLIFLPYWILGGLGVVFWLALGVMAPSESRCALGVTVMEQLAWFVGVILLARKWDGKDMPYRQALLPIYFAMVLKWIGSMLVLKKLRHDIQRMVTVEYLEKEVLKDKSFEDLPEEELEEIRREFFVVTVPPEFEPDVNEGEELDDEDLEEQKVESSPEFEAATDLYRSTLGGLVGGLTCGSTFLLTLTLKLDGSIDASWWAVFTPVWLYYGSVWLYAFFRCCFPSLPGEEIVLEMQQGGEEDKKERPSRVKREKNHEKYKNTRPRDSDFFEPESSMENFNASRELPEPVVAGSDQEKETDTKGPISNEADVKTNGKRDVKDGNTDENVNINDDDGRPNINIDEETFRAWQNAYEAAEEGAMEQQMKSVLECCSLSVKLGLICMVVAKVEQNFDSVDAEDTGFNTFWIIFPFLLFFGCAFCCCSCTIYSAKPGDAADLYGGVSTEDGNDVENPATASIEETIIFPASSSAEGGGGSNVAGRSTLESDDVDETRGESTTIDPSGTGASNTTESAAGLEDLD